MTGIGAPTHLFVYGTLAPGRANAHVLADVPGTWTPATVRGHFHAQGWGATEGFPALVPDSAAGAVDGFVLASAALPDAWPRLDAFEGEAYERVIVDAQLADGSVVAAFVYVLALPPERTADRERWLRAIPDIPRWVETRDLLAWSGSTAIEAPDGAGLVVWSADDGLGSAVGEPPLGALLRAAAGCEELLAFPDNVHRVRALLPDHHAERATIFRGPEGSPPEPEHPWRVIPAGDAEVLAAVPEPLRTELLDALADRTTMVATLDGTAPVAFAYVASETEGQWDLSIDTLASHRRRGFATSAVRALLRAMEGSGKAPVWGAVDSNVASLRMAERMGFRLVDELWVLSRTDDPA
jgi:gamma-glutamylcyclotransferase (GGCT)/AIG2-like uncharacterized protein YtfP